MTRRQHRYDGDIGGVAASRRRAVADRTAVGPDPAPRSHSGFAVAFALALAPAAIAAAGWLVGALFGWWSS